MLGVSNTLKIPQPIRAIPLFGERTAASFGGPSIINDITLSSSPPGPQIDSLMLTILSATPPLMISYLSSPTASSAANHTHSDNNINFGALDLSPHANGSSSSNAALPLTAPHNRLRRTSSTETNTMPLVSPSKSCTSPITPPARFGNHWRRGDFRSHHHRRPLINTCHV
jgi:hypothetical protein